jgi:hypothetical protein
LVENLAVVAGTEARPTKIEPEISGPPERVPLITNDETEARPNNGAGAKIPPKLEDDPPWRVTMVTVWKRETGPKFATKSGEGSVAE